MCPFNSLVNAFSSVISGGSVWRDWCEYLIPEMMAFSPTVLASLPMDFARSTTARISDLIFLCSLSKHSFIHTSLHASLFFMLSLLLYIEFLTDFDAKVALMSLGRLSLPGVLPIL